MSNKTTLQSNNALLSQSNTDLQALINTANALPDAGGGGGGSVETCTVTIVNAISSAAKSDITVLATISDSNGFSYTDRASSKGDTLTVSNVVCGSVLTVVAELTSIVNCTSQGGIGVTSFLCSHKVLACEVLGDGTLTVA